MPALSRAPIPAPQQVMAQHYSSETGCEAARIYGAQCAAVNPGADSCSWLLIRIHLPKFDLMGRVYTQMVALLGE